MPSFWSLISNGDHIVGCTGQSVYVYSADKVQLACFKDLKCAYTAAFSPRGDIFVVKTTDGRLGVYSLKTMSLIKKFRFSKVDGSQDDNFCFSADGELFYNIERHGESYISVLSVYRTDDFSLCGRYLDYDDDLCPEVIERGNDGFYYILGFERPDAERCTKWDDLRWFVARFSGGELLDRQYITDKEHEFYYWYKEVEAGGFTEKLIRLSPVEFFDIESLKEKKFTLEGLWKHYNM